MKQKAKSKKNEDLRDKMRSKALEEPSKILEQYFPKGSSKKRGEALALCAIAFNNGFQAGENYEKRRQKTDNNQKIKQLQEIEKLKEDLDYANKYANTEDD